MRISGRVALLIITVALILSAPLAHAQTLTPEMEKLKATHEKYKDPVVAIHDGYFSTMGCVTYANGGMGVHFLNLALVGPVPDPMKPPVLMYEPVGDRLQLVGVEWFVPLATGIKERPQLFGRGFNGPMEGHHPLLPTQLHHYDLHLWLFKSNPTGLFADVNPDVKCPSGHPYTFVEQPGKPVPHPQ
jgi:hypothetical protein